MEVGCGGGYLASTIAGQGKKIISSDILFDAVRFVKGRCDLSSIVFDAEVSWPINDQSFQTVIMLDVLEHIKNDIYCLKEARRVVHHDGTIILAVPAHQFLFSSWDRVLGHHRRYSKLQLYKILKEAGFTPIIFSYQNALSLLPAMVMRTYERITDSQLEHATFPNVPGIMNNCLKLWGRLETILIPKILPFGLSIFAVARPE